MDSIERTAVKVLLLCDTIPGIKIGLEKETWGKLNHQFLFIKSAIRSENASESALSLELKGHEVMKVISWLYFTKLTEYKKNKTKDWEE